MRVGVGPHAWSPSSQRNYGVAALLSRIRGKCTSGNARLAGTDATGGHCFGSGSPWVHEPIGTGRAPIQNRRNHARAAWHMEWSKRQNGIMQMSDRTKRGASLSVVL